MWVHKFILLVAMASTVDGKCKPKKEGICPPVPIQGTGCPFEGKHCVPAAMSGYDVDGLYNGACFDEGGGFLEIWVQTEDEKYVYADSLTCGDVGKPVTSAVDVLDTLVNDGKWRALAVVNSTELFTYVDVDIDVKRVVCARHTECPMCPDQWLAKDNCMEGQNCVQNPYLERKELKGVLGQEGSVCSVACGNADKTFIETDEGYQEVDSLVCDFHTHNWIGRKGEKTFPRKLDSETYCIN